MIRKSSSTVIVIFILLLVSCNGYSFEFITEVVESQTPPAVLADTFFSGCAILDENKNGIKDADESLLEGMTFSVILASGAEFRGQTYEGQCAFVTIPSALPEGSWPIMARMIVPEGSLYELSGPAEITLEPGQWVADFLFTQK